MKKTIILLSVLLLAVCAAAEKPELKPYGFIKGDMYYATAGVTSWFSDQPTAAAKASGGDTSSTAFTAQHSRFGITGKTSAGDVEVGGKLEMDFFSANSNTITNANPRMRQAYTWVKPAAGLDVRIGQQWDLFSPLNPTTNNTNANLWYNGNYGFRRAQFQVRYTKDLGGVKPEVQACIAEGTKEGFGVGEDNLAKIPQIQGRLGAGFMGKMNAGVSTIYGSYGVEREYSTFGISVDANLPVHKLCAIKGEFALGTNLNNANIFNCAGNGNDSTDAKNMGFWFNVTSKPMDYLHTVIGFAQENVTTDPLADGLIESNRAIYGDLIFPITDCFSIAAEVEHISTTRKGSDPDAAIVVDVAGKITF